MMEGRRHSFRLYDVAPAHRHHAAPPSAIAVGAPRALDSAVGAPDHRFSASSTYFNSHAAPGRVCRKMIISRRY